MRYLGQDERVQMMGIGALGEVRRGPDGRLYQWMEGVDGLGNPVGGWWSVAKRFARKAASAYAAPFTQALRFAQTAAPFIPGYGPAIAKGLTFAAPYLRRAGLSGYQAPDGTFYPMQGLDADELDGFGADEELRGLAAEELDGFGADEELRGLDAEELDGLGEVRRGPDGRLYQWMEGVDGLGNPVGGWWSVAKRFARKAASAYAAPFTQALRFAQTAAPFIPGYGPAIAKGLTFAAPYLRRAGLSGYQAPDGTFYPMQGLDADELDGFGADEELRGLAAEELDGFGADEELRGLAAEELDGFGVDEELRGLGADEDHTGMGDYILEPGMSGLDAYVPEQPPSTRMFVRPSRPPEMWAPLW